jgi:hypothetical protein
MKIRTVYLALVVATTLGCGDCGSSGANNGSNAKNAENGQPNSVNGQPSNVMTPTDPVELDPTDYTYTLEESPDGVQMWTTPATHKITSADVPPDATQSGLHLSAARGEFEPAQLAFSGGSGSATVSVEPFPDLGSEQRTELATVGFESGWAEYLNPGSEVTLGGNAAVWLTVFVPPDAPAGEHQTTLTVSVGGEEISVPVTLYVFDFSIWEERHFLTQMNVSVQELVGDGTVDEAKTLLWEHRMTPKSVSWPSGLGPNITWDTDRNPDPCGSFYDEPDEPDEYSAGWLTRRYLAGEGWNGQGFPSSMLFQFVDNSTPRPESFCGVSRGDHFGSDEYNTEWSNYLSALDAYLVENDYQEKAYYYVQNEPQDDEDHRLAAHLCRLTRDAAPNLRIAISEEPKPEIAEDPDNPCGYDIWIAHIRAFQPDYSLQRQQMGEELWFYSLDQDPDPFFNPTAIDRQGIHQRIIPWVSWSYAARGFAYYDAGRWFDGRNPTIRAALFREGFEDYEYLYLANDRSHPAPGGDSTVNDVASSVASSLTSWTKDVDAMMALRHELGLYIEGSRDTLPTLASETDARPRGSYYVNFQDPSGPPTADPLEVDGKTWMKIGWDAWDEDAGYGWSGENVGNPDIALYGYDDVGGFNDVQKSYLYDDYGRAGLFEFALENGTYEVTLGVGRAGRGSSDPHNATVEGEVVVDDEPTTDEAPLLERTVTVELNDGSLSLEIGGRSESSGDFAYTFVSYLAIEPVD